jgi:anti-sigma factor RsiW
MAKSTALPCGDSNDQHAPSERDLHAYVDHQLSDDDRRLVETYLSGNAPIAEQVRAWQKTPSNCAQP